MSERLKFKVSSLTGVSSLKKILRDGDDVTIVSISEGEYVFEGKDPLPYLLFKFKDGSEGTIIGGLINFCRAGGEKLNLKGEFYFPKGKQVKAKAFTYRGKENNFILLNFAGKPEDYS